jgi:hypothetical protein
MSKWGYHTPVSLGVRPFLHCLSQFIPEVVNSVLEWVDAVESGTITTGIWRTGVPYREVVREEQLTSVQKEEMEEGVLPLDGTGGSNESATPIIPMVPEKPKL